MKQSNSLELRIYRYLLVVLMGIMTSLGAYITDAVVTTLERLPAIEEQLKTLNNNFAKLDDLPVKVQTNNFRLEEHETRITRLENRVGGS